MKKILLFGFLFFYSSFLFSQTIQDEVLKKGEFKLVPIYTSGSAGYGYNGDQLGTFAVYCEKSGSSAKILGINRGSGLFYTWQGSIRKFYRIKVVDVVSIDIPGNVDITAGENYTYTPIVTDSEAETTLTWVSSNTSVATVNSSGVVTAASPGQTTITCTSRRFAML